MTGCLPIDIFKSLKKLFPQIENTMTIEEIGVIIQAGRMITKGDTKAFVALHDNLYGKPNQSITGADGEPLIPIADDIVERMAREVLEAKKIPIKK